MHGRRPHPILYFAALLLALLPSCGAGLVTGAVASNNGNGGARPPSLSLPGQEFPLVPVPSARSRTVVVANAQLSPSARLQVQLRLHASADPNSPALLTAEQLSPVVLSGQGGSTVVGFELDTAPIVQDRGVGDDLTARLAVLVDGREIGPPVPVTLLRQPSVRLFDLVPVLLSPLGQRVRLAVAGLRSLDAGGIQVSVITEDATGDTPSVTRVCLRPAFETPGGQDPELRPGEQLVTAEVPGNTFSGAADFLVDDLLAGRSTIGRGAYYRPEVLTALPPQGSTRGSGVVTLNGRALASLATGGAGSPDFDQLEVLFRKGDRVVTLGGVHREESSLDNLEFTLPPSPDGRAGNVDIVLRVHLPSDSGQPEVVAEVVAAGKFLYANPDPAFGSRGVVLPGDPIAVAPIAIEGAPDSRQATDFGVLYKQGNFASLQLLLSLENGMFTRLFGSDRLIGDPQASAEREPRDLVAGDFNGDRVPDLLVVNAGSGTATHHVVLGQPAPASPLGAVVRFSTPAGMRKARVIDLDGDTREDVVMFPGAGAAPGQRPIVLLQRSQAGVPAFQQVADVPVRPYSYDAFEIADLDGDGALDIAVVAAGSTMRLDVAYGNGAGGFVASAQLDLVVPLYQPNVASPAVGLHAMGAAPCSLAIVLSGLPSVIGGSPPGPIHDPNTPPLIVLVRPNGARAYAQPLLVDVLRQIGAFDPFRSSLAGNFDGVGVGKDELLVGASGERALTSFGFFRLTAANRFLFTSTPQFAGFELDALHLGIAFPADPINNQPEVPAVFVTHQLTIDGQRERRLSTVLVSNTPAAFNLLSPDVGFGTALEGIVGGRFSAIGVASGGATRDLAAPSGQNILIGDNNGFGALAPSNSMTHAGLVGETTTRIPAPPGVADVLAFFDDGTRHGRVDGQLRIGIWQPETAKGSPTIQFPTAFSGDLRPSLPPQLATLAVDAASRLQAADVDGDGLVDLVALVRFAGRLADDEAVLMVLRGRVPTPGDDFPFAVPLAGEVATVHGSSTSFALGDFAADAPLAPVVLELALAVPTSSTPAVDDGNHVRFYRLVASGNDLRWQRSFDQGGPQVLIVGTEPSRVVAADFDRNGTVDLLVAADGLLQLLLNEGVPRASPEVAIQSFSVASPREAQPGRHTNLLLGDINGDGNVDALLATEFTLASGALSSSVAYYLSTGTGVLSSRTIVSPTLLGDRNARLSVDLGDINSDGVPDLSIGWFQPGGGGDNLRVLLGSSR